METLVKQLNERGYVVLPQAVRGQLAIFLAVDILQRVQSDPRLLRGNRFGSGDFEECGAGFLGWGKKYIEILHLPSTLDFMRRVHRFGSRLDFVYGILSFHDAKSVVDSEFVFPHGGMDIGREHYCFEARQNILHGELVLQVALSDSGGERGGFFCVPGTHLSIDPAPEKIERSKVLCPELLRGDVLIFNNSAWHGTLPSPNEAPRIAICFKYRPNII